MHRRSLITTAASAALLPAVSRAQAFPSKQLRLIVGFAAGGGGDIVARVLGAELTKSGGYSVLVDDWIRRHDLRGVCELDIEARTMKPHIVRP